MDRFGGKVVLITGAASGLGRCLAVQVGAEGGQVFGVDVNEPGLAETQSLVSAAGGDFRFRTADISRRQQCQDTVAACVAELSRLDVLCNVAGVLRMGHLVDYTEDDFALVMGVNVAATVWMSQAAIPHLVEAAGNIVNIASNAGLMGQAYAGIYCASKGAVVNFTRSLAMELIKTKVRVNCVAPGGITTPLSANANLPGDADFALIQNAIGFRPMSDPARIATVVAFVASDDASEMTGSIVSADSGLTAG